MGDRWTLSLVCAFCGRKNDDVYYAPTCGFFNFTCKFCGEENGIRENFVATKWPMEEDNYGNLVIKENENE